jgi:hypothetical protein
MRTATRIALVLTGTAILIGAMATPGARADRAPIDHDQVSATTASQRARLQSLSDRIEYVQAAEVKTMATAIAHLSAAPEVANLNRGYRRVKSEVVLTRDIDGANDRPVVSSVACDGDTFILQQRNVSDGGRGLVVDGSEQASCLRHSEPKPRTRQAVIGDLDLSQTRSPEPAPVVLKFEAVIKIDLAGLSW